MLFFSREADPRTNVLSRDAVVETDDFIAVRPMALSGCQFGCMPALLMGVILAIGTWITGDSWIVPFLGAGGVFTCFILYFAWWNCRRDRGAYDLVVDKSNRRIHLLDRRSSDRVRFPFEQVEQISDRHSEVFAENDNEQLRFQLRGEWFADPKSPRVQFGDNDVGDLETWKKNRIPTGYFGDLLAELIGCPIIHTK